jgi:hypothetical protein
MGAPSKSVIIILQSRFLGLLPLLSGLLIGGCLVYCAVWWIPHPMALGDLDCSPSCWAYCVTQSPLWAAVTVIFSAELCAIGILITVSPTPRRHLTALIVGIITFPTGFLAMIPWLTSRLQHPA